MNCAFSCLESGKIDDAFEYVKTLVVAFPDYIDGLVLYGKFLLHYASLGEESDLTKALRNKGLKSIDMEIQDAKPRIPVSDCLFRMEESLKRRATLDGEKATLQIEYLKLKWLSDKTTSSEQMVIDIWEMIEKNSIMAGTNNNIITDFIVTFFIKQNQFEQANQILTSVLKEKYGFHSTVEMHTKNFLTDKNPYRNASFPMDWHWSDNTDHQKYKKYLFSHRDFHKSVFHQS